MSNVACTYSPHVVFPQDTFAFLIGINAEWTQGRNVVGDEALFYALKETYKIPSDRICFVKDEKATKQNVTTELESLLQKTTTNSTFFFYYGGHGNPNSFQTMEEEWTHLELCQMFKNFRGELVCCCYSGNFYESIKATFDRDNDGKDSKNEIDCVRACIMSTQLNQVAGGEWTLTECWIHAIQGRLVAELATSCCLRMELFIDYASDKTAQVKGDVLTFQIHPCNQRSIEKVRNSIFPTVDHYVGSTTSKPKTPKGTVSKLTRHLSKLSLKKSKSKGTKSPTPIRQAQLSSQLLAWRSDVALQSQHLRVGDYAFAKWKGGCPSSSLMKNPWHILPLWFPCEILSRYDHDPSEVISEEEICVDNRRDIIKFRVMYHDRQTSYSWDDVVSIQDILPKAWFSTSDESLHDSYIEAQCIMAKRGQYITHSIAPNSHIRVKFWDGIIYEAVVSDWKDIPWDEFIQGLLIEGTPSTEEIDGPYLPVWWAGEDMYSLMPLSHVIVTAGSVS